MIDECQNNTLDIKTIVPLYAEKGRIFISAQQLPSQARIISSNLTTPIQGMQLRTQEVSQ